MRHGSLDVRGRTLIVSCVEEAPLLLHWYHNEVRSTRYHLYLPICWLEFLHWICDVSVSTLRLHRRLAAVQQVCACAHVPMRVCAYLERPCRAAVIPSGGVHHLDSLALTGASSWVPASRPALARSSVDKTTAGTEH